MAGGPPMSVYYEFVSYREKVESAYPIPLATKAQRAEVSHDAY